MHEHMGTSLIQQDVIIILFPSAPQKNQVYLVTGSTDGIGQHTATKLAQGGATVLVHGRFVLQNASLSVFLFLPVCEMIWSISDFGVDFVREALVYFFTTRYGDRRNTRVDVLVVQKQGEG